MSTYINPYFLCKTLHIVFVVSWFAGLFYLPRIFVNMAMVEKDGNNQPVYPPEYDRLILMANKLFRFMTILAVPAIGFGLYLWLGLGIKGGWMHGKLFLVLLILGYHHSCWLLLKKFRKHQNTRNHRWYRWYNEAPVLLLLFTVYIVVAKPF